MKRFLFIIPLMIMMAAAAESFSLPSVMQQSAYCRDFNITSDATAKQALIKRPIPIALSRCARVFGKLNAASDFDRVTGFEAALELPPGDALRDYAKRMKHAFMEESAQYAGLPELRAYPGRLVYLGVEKNADGSYYHVAFHERASGVFEMHQFSSARDIRLMPKPQYEPATGISIETTSMDTPSCDASLTEGPEFYTTASSAVNMRRSPQIINGNVITSIQPAGSLQAMLDSSMNIVKTHNWGCFKESSGGRYGWVSLDLVRWSSRR